MPETHDFTDSLYFASLPTQKQLDGLSVKDTARFDFAGYGFCLEVKNIDGDIVEAEIYCIDFDDSENEHKVGDTLRIHKRCLTDVE